MTQIHGTQLGSDDGSDDGAGGARAGGTATRPGTGAGPSGGGVSPALTVLYAGAEAPDPEELAAATGVPVVTSARQLSAVVSRHAAAVADGADPLVTVVPAGTGRDLTSVTQAAQALRWLVSHGQRACLAGSLANATYTVARLRHHLRQRPAGTDAVVFLARSVDPFADAELVRRVRLARQYSDDLEVELAFEGDGAWPVLDDVLARLRTLGATSPVVVRADLGLTGEGEPLFRPRALQTAVATVAAEARHLAGHGDDGIDAGLLADHDQGFAHSHGDEDEVGGHTHPHSHGHSHAHSHAHSHSHSHDHGHAHSHDHAHTHSHDHGHAHSHDHGHTHDHGHSHDHGHDTTTGED